MFSEKSFRLALLISLAAHGALLGGNLNFHFPVLNQDKKENIEVKYIKSAAQNNRPQLQTPPKQEPFFKLPPKITADKRIPPPFIDKEDIFKGKQNNPSPIKQEIAKTEITRPEIIAIKKKITIPPINIDKNSDPSYIGYYQIVREKIRRAAYQNYSGDQTGEVALSFSVSKEGYLEEVRVVEEKSSLSEYLREVALKSIKYASPFPAFPKELDFSQLPFTLQINFQIE